MIAVLAHVKEALGMLVVAVGVAQHDLVFSGLGGSIHSHGQGNACGSKEGHQFLGGTQFPFGGVVGNNEGVGRLAPIGQQKVFSLLRRFSLLVGLNDQIGSDL